ncbi:protein Shroom, partial [Gryllus bimaculatus]
MCVCVVSGVCRAPVEACGGGGGRRGHASPPPVRDASSLKSVKYGPGHEKFPSWPLKTVLERCEKIPPEAFESRGEREREALEEMAARGPLYLPRVDREGNELGDIDYLVPSPPERDLEEFAKAGGHAHPAAAAAACGRRARALARAGLRARARAPARSPRPTWRLHSLRRDSEVAGEGRPVPGPQAPPSSSACSSAGAGAGPGAWEEAAAAAERERDRERPGRDSVVTTSSGSASSSETLKWHGSLSDVSVASSSCAPPAAHAHGATHAHAGGGSRQLIAHSARVQTPQRHHSESVLYLGQAAAAAAAARASHHSHKLRLFPVHTYTVQPPQEQPATAQAQPQAQAQAQAQTQQQQAQPPAQSPPQSPQQQQTQPGHRNMPVSPTQPTLSVAERISELERQQQQQQQQQQPQQSQLQQQQTRYTYYDPDKRHRVSDPTLKAIQKKALLSFYERHHQGPVVQAGVPSRSHQTTWRSEPHLAQPAVPMPCPPQSPPPPQPPPRPRNGSQSARRASSASDYAGGAWREMTANREPASSETNNMRETARHQHSCGSLSTDLLGPVIMGPSISVDDWVPERPPKKPHLRTAFPPPVPDRMASPDLPPPSPPPVLEDEVFATDEPLPPPPPDLRPSDWPFASELSPEKSQKPSESSSDVPRFSEKESSVKQTDYTNLSPRSSESTQKSQVECSQRHEREVCMPIARHQESSCQMPRQAENPPSPQRSQTLSSSFQKHNEAGSVCHNHPDNSPCSRQQDLELPNAPLHHRQDSISHNKYPDIPSKEQKHIDSCSISSKHSDTRSPEMSAFVQKYSQNSQRYSENNHHVQRHPETEFSNHRYLENGSTAHPRILETGHAVHRHLETGATMQRHNEVMQRHSENNVNHRHSESNHGAQRHSETSYSLQRPIPQRTVDNDNVPSRQSESYHQGNNSFIQRHSESNLPQKFSESFSSARSFQQEHFNKSFKHDENVSHQFSHNTSHQRHPDIRQYESNSHPQKYSDNESTTHRNQHSNTLQKNYENGISSHNSHGPPSPKKENISMQKCVENGAINQAHMENNMRQFERYHENGCPPPVHRYPEGGGTLNRRYLESNRSLDGSSAMYRYHESNSLGHRYNRPSGMRSTENLHQKCLETPMSKTLDSWTAQKYSTQKLVVNGKLAAPLPDRTVQNGGFTDSLRMSPRSPPHSQMSSPRSVAQGHSTEHRHVAVPGARSPPREKGLLPGGPRSPPHSVAGPMMSHIITSSQADSKNQSLGDAAPHIEQSTSKASYIAYRRERDRGLPNFEGSYKRTMSPSERPEVLVDTPASSPVPECDRLSVGESSSAASLEEKDFRASALHACSNACSNACSDKTPPGIKEEPPIVMERLDLLPAPAGRTSPRSPPRVLGREASPDVVPALALALALAPAPAPSPAPPPRVESETQCDLTEDKGGPSPAPDSPPRSPAPAPAHAHATAAPSPKVQVTECLQLVQRSEVVLRVNAATSDAASQTEVEQEADAPAPTPPASPT